jgi:hypothetical protein
VIKNSYDSYNHDADFESTIWSSPFQAGLKLTTSLVPGLYGNIGFQYNLQPIFGGYKDGYPKPFKMAFTLSAGYTY